MPFVFLRNILAAATVCTHGDGEDRFLSTVEARICKQGFWFYTAVYPPYHITCMFVLTRSFSDHWIHMMICLGPFQMLDTCVRWMDEFLIWILRLLFGLNMYLDTLLTSWRAPAGAGVVRP